MSAKRAALQPSPFKRPMPPADIGILGAAGGKTVNFVPAPEARTWALEVLVTGDGPLVNPDHSHIAWCDLEFMWASSGFQKGMRQVIGQTEMPMFQGSGWKRWRQEEQFEHWFGRVPKFVITLDAAYCRECTDTEFCALVDHELYHIGQVQEFGAPKFNKRGEPVFGMRGHDVEEFVGIVARYGTGGPDSAVTKMVAAANSKPTVAPFSIAHVCGTCIKQAA